MSEIAEYFDDDVDYSDETCPKCGSHTYSRQCNACEDGWQNRYEEDPLWYDDDFNVPCDECRARGYHHWCPQCAYDLAAKRWWPGDEPWRLVLPIMLPLL